MRIFMDKLYVIWIVMQNPCGCCPLDLMIETKTPGRRWRNITYSGARNQLAIEEFLEKRFILELK